MVRRSPRVRAALWRVPVYAVRTLVSAMKAVIREGKLEPRFKPKKNVGLGAPVASKTAVQFVKALLTRDPKVRTTAKDALQMSYMTDCESKPCQGLPSMRPMLAAAVKSGAFENRQTDVEDDLDEDLGQLHLRYTGQLLEHRLKSSPCAQKCSRDILKKERRLPCDRRPSDAGSRSTVASTGSSSHSTRASNLLEMSSHTTHDSSGSTRDSRLQTLTSSTIITASGQLRSA